MIILHQGAWQQFTWLWRSTHRVTQSRMHYIILEMVKFGYTRALEHAVTKATIIPICHLKYILRWIYIGKEDSSFHARCPHTCQGYFCICVHYIWFCCLHVGWKFLIFQLLQWMIPTRQTTCTTIKWLGLD